MGWGEFLSPPRSASRIWPEPRRLGLTQPEPRRCSSRGREGMLDYFPRRYQMGGVSPVATHSRYPPPRWAKAGARVRPELGGRTRGKPCAPRYVHGAPASRKVFQRALNSVFLPLLRERRRGKGRRVPKGRVDRLRLPFLFAEPTVIVAAPTTTQTQAQQTLPSAGRRFCGVRKRTRAPLSRVAVSKPLSGPGRCPPATHSDARRTHSSSSGWGA